jgi:enoyl-CoA hydratase/carnithine racemase
MTDPVVLYEARDGIAWLTLNRPEVLNALNLQMRDELWVLLEAIALDDSVRAVVFRGAGDRAFSSGADLTEFGTAPSFTEARRGRLDRDLWHRFAHFEKPMIAAVHGYALGAGCELSLLCDLRIASEDARFGLPETHLGYVPTAGGSQTLPRTAGLSRALDMILTAEPITAQRALEYGIVNQVVPRAAADATAETMARRLATLSTNALKSIKQSIREGADVSLRDSLRLERRLAIRNVIA